MLEAVADLPTIVISDLFGVSATSAHRWARFAQDSWADQLAARTHDNPGPSEGFRCQWPVHVTHRRLPGRELPGRARSGACFGRERRLSLQLVECLVGIGYGLGVDVVGAATVGDLLPVGPGEYPLDHEYLGG